MLIAVAVLGLLVGSFINAAVWRIHEKAAGGRLQVVDKDRLSITRGRSMCPNCKHPLAPLDLIPVISWILLRGRCSYCSKPISVQYPIVELLTAALFTFSYYNLQPASWNLIFWLYILAVLLILAIYDLKWMLLPDVVLLPTIAISALYLFTNVLIRQSLSVVYGPVIAAFAAGGLFYFLAFITRGKGMGGGDIKLAFLMGLLLGIQKTMLALFLGFLSAALVAVVLVGAAWIRKTKRPRYIAFGPFLIAGTIIAMLFGTQIITWYMNIV